MDGILGACLLLLQLQHEKTMDQITDEVREVAVAQYFARHNAPLESGAQRLISAAKENGLDWRLLPAIATIESGGGRHIPEASYNPYGWGCSTADACHHFSSWDRATEEVAAGLGYARHYEKWRQDAGNLWLLADSYNGGDKRSWLRRLQSEFDKLQAHEDRIRLGEGQMRQLQKQLSFGGDEAVQCRPWRNVSAMSGVLR